VVVVKLMERISRYNEIKRCCNRSIFSILFPSSGDLFCLQNVNAGVLLCTSVRFTKRGLL
jgi:hypothetical protein